MNASADDPKGMQTDEWTDKRLDDLVERLATNFDRLDHDVRELRGEVRSLQKGGLAAAVAIIAAIIGTGILT